MTQPLSTDLLFRFYFTKLGVPYTPSPAPTLVFELPDGTQSTPALTTVRTGEFSYTHLAAGVTLAGSYIGIATTTDATADYFASQATWEVGTNDVVSIWTYTTRTLSAFAFTVNATITGIAAGAIEAASFAANALDAVWSTTIRTITGGTVATATNLTNAPTNGDFTTAMKTSLNNATPTVTVGAITTGVAAADVLNALAASYDTPNTIGAKINDAGAVGDPWAVDLVAGGYTGNEAGAIELAIKARTDLIASGTWSVISPVTTDADGNVVVTLTKGDDYYDADGFDLVFAVPVDYPDITGASAALSLSPNLGPVSAFYVANDFIKFNIPRTTTQYLANQAGNKYEVKVTLTGGHVLRPLIGLLNVIVGLTS